MSMFIRPQLSSGVSTLTTNVIMSTGSTRQESEINLDSVNQETNTFKCQKVNTTMTTGRNLNATLPLTSCSSSGTTVCVGKSHGPNLSLTFIHPKYKFMEMRLPLLSSLEEPDGNLLHIVLDENGLLENKRVIFEQKNVHIQAFMKLEDAEQFKKDRTIIKCPQRPKKSKNETMAEKCAVDDFQTLIDLFTNCMDEETREYNKFAQRMFFLSEKGTENLLQKDEYENLVDFYELPQGPIAIGKKPTGEWCIACVKADKATPGKDVDGTGSAGKSGSSNLTIKSITRNFYVGSSDETFQTSSSQGSQVYGNNPGPKPCGSIIINQAADVQGPQVFGSNVLNKDAGKQELQECGVSNNHSNQTSQVYIDDGIIYQVKEEPEDSDYERGENSTRDQASHEETTKRETRIGTQNTYVPIKRKAEEEETDVNMYIYPSTSSDVQQDQEMSENTEDSLDTSITSSNEQQSVNREAKNKRFKFVTAEEMQELQQRKISASTMKNTKWGVNIFQEWSKEVYGSRVKFETIDAEKLNNLLCRFYTEASPKGEKSGQEYSKNTFKNVRAAVNRHLRDFNRNIDIVRDKSFQKSNDILEAIIRTNIQKGLSLPTKHKEILTTSDIAKINAYLFSKTNAEILQHRVFFILASQFLLQNRQLAQLKLKSFKFNCDENTKEYASLTPEFVQECSELEIGGEGESLLDKKMYATGDEKCPVANLKLLIGKTDRDAVYLFNNFLKDQPFCWYGRRRVKYYRMSRFMGEISKNAGCSKIYTLLCVRATLNQRLIDAKSQTIKDQMLLM